MKVKVKKSELMKHAQLTDFRGGEVHDFIDWEALPDTLTLEGEPVGEENSEIEDVKMAICLIEKRKLEGQISDAERVLLEKYIGWQDFQKKFY